MRAKEFISEVFDTAVQGKIVRSSPDLFTTRATIGQRDIIFNTAFYNNDRGQSVAEVDFVEKVPGDTRFSKTQSGNEMAVFSFVLDSLKEMTARYHPELIEFSSWKADGNRTALYVRMVKRYAPTVGYHLAGVAPGSSDDHFVIKRNTDK